MSAREIRAQVNGAERRAAVEPRRLLSDFIRHDLGLTGTHVGCEQGVCGSCTVLLDGEPVRSCLLLAVQAQGRTIETVESLAVDGELSALQQRMMEEHGLQCGFCTPGILMSLVAADRAGSTDDAAEAMLGGHLCRCTGYVGIRATIRRHWESREAAS